VLSGLNYVLVTTGAKDLSFSGTNLLGTELCTTYEASSPGVLGVRRTSYINSSQICVHKRVIQLRGQAFISMSLCNFSAHLCPYTRVASWLSWLSARCIRVTLWCVASVRGKGSLQSCIREGVGPLLSIACQVFKTVRRSGSVAPLKIYRIYLSLLLTIFYIILVFRLF